LLAKIISESRRIIIDSMNSEHVCIYLFGFIRCNRWRRLVKLWYPHDHSATTSTLESAHGNPKVQSDLLW